MRCSLPMPRVKVVSPVASDSMSNSQQRGPESHLMRCESIPDLRDPRATYHEMVTFPAVSQFLKKVTGRCILLQECVTSDLVIRVRNRRPLSLFTRSEPLHKERLCTWRARTEDLYKRVGCKSQ